jgi:hypothetical protein
MSPTHVGGSSSNRKPPESFWKKERCQYKDRSHLAAFMR